MGAGPDLVVPVPDGWHVLRSAHPVAGVAETSLCLLPPGRAVRSCAGIRIAWGPDLPGPRGAGDYAPGRHAGWYDGTETAQCPVGRATDVVVRRRTG
ncbi:hypothetical protein KDN32_10225 [Nocardioides sp. J2M5]|uniref:hypothetical protein n=1 Tax=Nocardioides palaemonis TaxID=2829810 RepID=UPI001BA963BE|nr:hypothetical protein [Nocardioides palaemonis]MBS2938119.1 hypothetical protein [Nocardioides palaemonis]